MTAPVVYDSMFGTTATITEAIATGLRETMIVEVYAVQDAPIDTSWGRMLGALVASP